MDSGWKPKIGVCSWSLQPTSPGDLAARVSECGVEGVQLALDPIRRGEWDEAEAISALREVPLLSGMMATHGEDYSTLETIRQTGGLRPDRHWEANLAAARDNAALAERLGLKLVTLHAGFLPHDSDDPERSVMVQRLRSVSQIFADHGVRLGLETGQESAETLDQILDEIADANVGVNFDPANMLLYGMGDPVEALRRLSPRILQVHIKDALPARVPGEWGRETAVGMGAVRWSRFFAALRECNVRCNLIIEREAGAKRVEDVIVARDVIRRRVG